MLALQRNYQHAQEQHARHCLAIGLLLLLLVTITIYNVNSEKIHFNLVRRRAFYNLAKMIACTTELSRYSVFDDYHDYGCWCGLGGAGRIMDDSDRCCSEHDGCYTNVSCPLDITRYMLSYNYKIDDCENNNTSLITCRSSSWFQLFPSCAEAICRCDREIAECLAEARPSYNLTYRDIDRDSVCGEPHEP